MRYMRDLRLIPIALIASACLLVIKLADLAFDGGRWFAAADVPASSASVIRTSPDALQQPGRRLSWAQEMFNFQTDPSATADDMALSPEERRIADRAGAAAADPDITGSIGKPGSPAVPGKGGKGGKPAKSATPDKTVATVPPPADGIVIPMNGAKLPSGAEREILERLQQRREELDRRSRALDIRENLVKAAEQRIDAKLKEIQEVEARIKEEINAKNAAEAARFKGLVTMYENMKSRDAAKIFDGLDMDVLIKVVSMINPRNMADIMAQMTPAVAQRLTVELASRAERPAKNDPAQLPKIKGTPTAQK
jgi:flagellar motility protein MotE (MotC chaperone)